MTRVEKLRAYLEDYYREHGQNLLFHGWHHIAFVTDKASALAVELNEDVDTIAAAALTHDLNYLVDSYSCVTKGSKLRHRILSENGYNTDEIKSIEHIVDQADLGNRNESICIEAQILSDADTLFKSLPITTPAFTGRYLAQTNISIGQLACNIAKVQRPLMDQGIYFYTEPYRARYMVWAKRNLELWESVADALRDKDVHKMLESAGIQP